MSQSTSAKRKMPTPAAIRQFWSQTSIWRFKSFDSRGEFLEPGLCFACGWHSENLERAHIVARSLGGSDSADNIHLLCPTCHMDSEYLGEPNSDPYQARYYAWFFGRTMEDRQLSIACRAGMSPSDFMKGDEHLYRRAIEVFGADSPVGLKLTAAYFKQTGVDLK